RPHLSTARPSVNVRVTLRKLVRTNGPDGIIRRGPPDVTCLTAGGQRDCARAFADYCRRALESARAVARGRRGRSDSASLFERPQGARLSERRRADLDALALRRDADARGRQSTARKPPSARNAEGGGRAHRRHGQRAGELDVHALILVDSNPRARAPKFS